MTVLAIGGAAGAAAIAPVPSPPEKITARGVGDVKLGETYRSLRRDGLVRRIRPGCELGGPGTRSARLRAPLRGTVNFTRRKPRRVRDISIRRGAEARGVGIGDRIRDIRDAYPKAKVERSTEEVFRITLVKVPKKGGGRIQFAVDVDTRRITVIGVPYVAFCE